MISFQDHLKLCLKPTELDKKPYVFFATSDPKAIEIIHALHEMNYHISGDIVVLGFDNVELSSVPCQSYSKT